MHLLEMIEVLKIEHLLKKSRQTNSKIEFQI